MKSEVLVLGRLKTLVCRESGRSSDFIAPSLANDCLGACAYCYVDRNKPVNPITLFPAGLQSRSTSVTSGNCFPNSPGS